MPRHDDLHAHFGGAPHDLVEVVYLEPQQNAVPIRHVITVADQPMMVFHLKAVQLKHKAAIRNQALIFPASMVAPAAQQTLIPPAAGFDIRYGNQGLRTHRHSV